MQLTHRNLQIRNYESVSNHPLISIHYQHIKAITTYEKTYCQRFATMSAELITYLQVPHTGSSNKLCKHNKAHPRRPHLAHLYISFVQTNHLAKLNRNYFSHIYIVVIVTVLGFPLANLYTIR